MESVETRVQQLSQIYDNSDTVVFDLNSFPIINEFEVGNRGLILEPVRELIRIRAAGEEDVLTKAIRRYEVEYASASELANYFTEANGLLPSEFKITEDQVILALDGKPNYTYWTPLMEYGIFKNLTGINIPEISSVDKFLDVGAGSADFIRRLMDWGVEPSQIDGVDISPTSAERVSELGANGVCGRLDNVLEEIDAEYKAVFLSYFVDRDVNQYATFCAALDLVQTGGVLVLEGLFPCETFDPNGISYVDESSNTITKGRFAVEDIDLICTQMEQIAKEKDIQVRIKSVASGMRKVWSRDGLEELTSDFIVVERCA